MAAIDGRRGAPASPALLVLGAGVGLQTPAKVLAEGATADVQRPAKLVQRPRLRGPRPARCTFLAAARRRLPRWVVLPVALDDTCSQGTGWISR